MSPSTDRDPRADNALKFGLFAATPHIRENEQTDFNRMAAGLRSDIAPAGALEELLTSEIITASWRLRRCAMVEAHLATQSDLDPMLLDDANGKTQKSIDRARAQSHTIIRRSMAELRNLQTERTIRHELALGGVGLEDLAKVLRVIAANPRREAPGEPESNAPEEPPSPEDLFCKPDASLASSAPAASLFWKKPGRNQPCPCGSRIKYKKCCGNPANPLRKQAA